MVEHSDYSQGSHKWLVALTVLFGTFMAVMDVSVVNVSMPHMMGNFGADLNSITWVATSYAIAQIIMATMAGWLVRMIGRKRLYLIAFGVFIAGSMLAGTARTFEAMIVYRAIQGMGGGCVIPISQAILQESFPPKERGMAMAIYGMGVVLAPAIGPIVGGWLTDNYGWPWIFYINVPVGVAGMIMVAAYLKDPHYLRRGVERIDWFGLGLLTIGLTCMQLVLEKGQRENWFESSWIVAGTVVTLVSLAVLCVWELHVKEPVIDLRLLKHRPLAVGSAVGLVFGIGLFGTTFILPQFTQTLLGYPAYQSGLVLAPRVIPILLMMPLAGWLYRYLDARLMVLFGTGLIAWSYWELTHLALTAGYWNIAPMLLLMGAGMPFMFVTLTAISMTGIEPKDITHAASLYTTTRFVGGNIGYAVTATLVANGMQVHRSYLVEHVSNLNTKYLALQQGATGYVFGHGVGMVDAQHKATALVNGVVDRQAAMMSYNDASWVLGLLFLATIPLLLLLPGRPHTELKTGELAAE